jgi:hypothetical protein
VCVISEVDETRSRRESPVSRAICTDLKEKAWGGAVNLVDAPKVIMRVMCWNQFVNNSG